MKTRLFFSTMITLLFCSFSYAQGHHRKHHDQQHTSYTYVNNSGDYYAGERHDRPRRSDYNRYDRYYDIMSRHDRKRLRGLINKLEERKRCAWEDGYVSNREHRRIRDVEVDIDRLLHRYRKHDSYYERGYRYRTTSCR